MLKACFKILLIDISNMHLKNKSHYFLTGVYFSNQLDYKVTWAVAVQVMDWFYQASSHHQLWPRIMSHVALIGQNSNDNNDDDDDYHGDDYIYIHIYINSMRMSPVQSD